MAECAHVRDGSSLFVPFAVTWSQRWLETDPVAKNAEFCVPLTLYLCWSHFVGTGFEGPRDTNCGFPLTIFRRELSQRNWRAGCEERFLSSPTAGVGRKRPPQPGKKRPPQSKEKWRRRFRVNLRSRPGTCAVPSRPSERTLRVGAPGSHHARGAVGGAVASRWRPRTFGHLKITVTRL